MIHEVYEIPEVNPPARDCRGNVDRDSPRSCYDKSKWYGKSLIRTYRNQHDISVRIGRIFNMYAPPMRADEGRVIPIFINQTLADEDLTLHDDGSQTQTFCYISDLIASLERLRTVDVQTPVNLRKPDERSILDLIELILKLVDIDSAITYESRPPKDSGIRRSDLTKAKRDLDWAAEVDLRQGLAKTIAYFERMARSPPRP